MATEAVTASSRVRPPLSAGSVCRAEARRFLGAPLTSDWSPVLATHFGESLIP